MNDNAGMENIVVAHVMEETDLITEDIQEFLSTEHSNNVTAFAAFAFGWIMFHPCVILPVSE